MSGKLPVSVHILTRDSASTLPRALASVTDCAEILIVDGGSKDQTLVLGKAANATILEQPANALKDGRIVDFAAVRNVALQHTTQPWILVLDSDEYISPELLEEIRSVTAKNEPAAFWIPRRYVLPDGTIIRYATTYPNEHLYFFHRDVVEEWTKPVHERVRLKPGTIVRHLYGASLAPLGTLAEYWQKNEQYLKIEAERSRGQGWMHWITRRLIPTLRSRLIALVKLAWIWSIPHSGKRLPLAHELARLRYAMRLLKATNPLHRPQP